MTGKADAILDKHQRGKKEEKKDVPDEQRWARFMQGTKIDFRFYLREEARPGKKNVETSAPGRKREEAPSPSQKQSAPLKERKTHEKEVVFREKRGHSSRKSSSRDIADPERKNFNRKTSKKRKKKKDPP